MQLIWIRKYNFRFIVGIILLKIKKVSLVLNYKDEWLKQTYYCIQNKKFQPENFNAIPVCRGAERSDKSELTEQSGG